MRIHNMAGALVAAAAVGGLLTGCGSNTTTATSTTTAPPAATNAPATGQQQHNQADVVFLQNMIPHHQQAIMMSQMALTHATIPQVKDLATRIGVPLTFRTSDPIRSGPERRGINARTAQEVHA